MASPHILGDKAYELIIIFRHLKHMHGVYDIYSYGRISSEHYSAEMLIFSCVTETRFMTPGPICYESESTLRNRSQLFPSQFAGSSSL